MDSLVVRYSGPNTPQLQPVIKGHTNLQVLNTDWDAGKSFILAYYTLTHDEARKASDECRKEYNTPIVWCNDSDDAVIWVRVAREHLSIESLLP